MASFLISCSRLYFIGSALSDVRIATPPFFCFPFAWNIFFHPLTFSLYICCLQETHFRPRDTNRLKVKGWKKIFHANGNQKKAGVPILISDKIDFKIKNIIRNKEGRYIMIKGSIQEEDITIVNVYAANIGAPQYIR